jgi:hypothetical protein
MSIMAGTLVWPVRSAPWSIDQHLRHLVSSAGCAAAQGVGLAPARRGQPGHHAHLDADDDGVSCEPWLPRRWTLWNAFGGGAMPPHAVGG